jgi:predicted XRE-type DNA-binding protein
MSKTTEPLEVVHGSGNVFADLDYPNAHVHQAKAVLAAEIIKALDAGGLTVRKAEVRTGIAAADFSRIRNADVGRFTIDRLIRILERLDTTADVQLTVVRPPATVVTPAVRS